MGDCASPPHPAQIVMFTTSVVETLFRADCQSFDPLVISKARLADSGLQLRTSTDRKQLHSLKADSGDLRDYNILSVSPLVNRTLPVMN